MRISIIVPIYNAESYIKECIHSILDQVYKEWELILVDDGSVDLSGAICDEFAARDDRIQVIHKKNEGLICARITGIEAARGEFLSFVDADDWVDKCFLKRLVNGMESIGADIVISGCVNEQKDFSANEINRIPAGVYEKEELAANFIPKMLHYEGFYQFGVLPYLCNKLFRKRKLQKFYSLIDTKIYDGEDVAVVYPYLLSSSKVVVIEDCLYHYRIHENSMSAQKGDRFYENVSRLYLHLNRQFQMSEYYPVMLPQLNQYMRRMVWLGIPEEIKIRERYCFPFSKVPHDSNVVLYGAGSVGLLYAQQIKKTKYCHVVLWADRNHLSLQKQGLAVKAPEMIAKETYDLVVVANAKPEIRGEIRKDLISLGVQREQIVMGEEDGD
ncbi:MAG: glycosyltransferase [Lachnospiraceae bacterium]|nr:glycosyltransferase [Lachnospiraceae bacterium]